jgi:hypothetical protein
MCMLSYYPPGVMPVRSRIINGAAFNPDGHGFALVTNKGKLMVYRSMNADKTIDAFITARQAHMNGPALFHSRIATSGRVDATGVHPFRVGGDAQTVLGHNGILFRPKEKGRSDTRIFAEDMLPTFGNLDKPKTFQFTEHFLGKGNKAVILTVNPAYKSQSYILNEKQGIWDEGEWHSNDDYKSTPFDSDSYWAEAKSARYTPGYSQCVICGRYAVDNISYLCNACGTCQDCLEPAECCECYLPASAKSAAVSAHVFMESEKR